MEFKNDLYVLIDNKDMMRDGGTFSGCPIGWWALVRQLFNDIRERAKAKCSS